MKSQGYHPSLPSIEKAKESYNLVTSDHVPLLATVPINELEETKEVLGPLKIVTWNVLEQDAANGFSPLGQSSYGETKEQTQARHTRIALSLAKFTKVHAPQFICLQEIRGVLSGDGLYSKISSALPHYVAIESEGSIVDAHECITLYNAEQFQPTSEMGKRSLKHFKQDKLGGNTTEYQRKGSNLRVRIVNVHSEFNPIPEAHEHYIRQYLQETDDNTVSIVVGDFNCMVAPLDLVPRNIATSATVSRFREDKLQGACAIDGCFYAHASSDGNPAICKQASTEHLNYRTGEVYTPHELTPLKIDDLPDLQKKEVSRYEMMVSVDGSFKNNHYQDELRTELADESVVVRVAKNLKNERGVGITLPRECYENLKNCGDSRFSLRMIEGFTPRYTVFASENNAVSLQDHIKDFCIHIRELHQGLLEVTNSYLAHLQANVSRQPAEIELYNKKLVFVQDIKKQLDETKTRVTGEKIQAMRQIRRQLSGDQLISQYRGADWKRYLRNLGVILACTVAFPIGGIAALVSYMKYNTPQFWRPTGYKAKQLLLFESERVLAPKRGM